MSSAVYLVSAQRSPIGAFLGQLSAYSAPALASPVIQALVAESKLDPAVINEVILGCVLTAGMGQAPARQAMRMAGLPDATAALTINKVCGSGLKAIMLGAQSILCGQADVVLAGGMESMSQVPFYLPRLRQGHKYGHTPTLDGILHDGLWDPYQQIAMGTATENTCVPHYQLSREAQDAYALQSYQRSRHAIEHGWFADEIVSFGEVKTDEQPFKDKLEKLPQLKSVFIPAGKTEGTITAGNASTLNDGAAVVLLASEQAVAQYQLSPMAKIVAMSTHSHDPQWFSTAPIGAIEKLLLKTGWSAASVGHYEINEAFSAVAMAAIQALALNPERVNPRGGAVSLGHPIGASGARIVTTMAHAMRQTGMATGIATLCIGGGEAVAVALEAC